MECSKIDVETLECSREKCRCQAWIRRYATPDFGRDRLNLHLCFVCAVAAGSGKLMIRARASKCVF